jgi:uncharacterized protein
MENKMNKSILFVLLIVFSLPSLSSDLEKRQSIDELMNLMNVDAMMDAMYAQMDQMFIQMVKEMDLKESEKPIFEKYMLKISQIMRREMSWAKMKDPLIAIYMKHFSEKELNDLLVFYKSESGMKMIEKMPVIMQESMMISQSMLKEFIPKIREISNEMKDETKTARSK